VAAAVPDKLNAAERGLDWLNLFVANVQTGFGPFVAVYLTTQGWTQTAIGFALSLGTASSMISQVPAGLVVDATRRKSLVAGFSIIAFTAAALMFAATPTPLFVYLAKVLHGVASCTLGPSIAAMSLIVAGQAAVGLRLGRNMRYLSIGNGVGAALMGACGYLLSEQAVFFLTALLTLPALAALVPLSTLDASAPTVGPGRMTAAAAERVPLRVLLQDRRLLVFGAAAMLFTAANGPLLPLAGTILTKTTADWATPLIAACIVLPQLIVALIAPRVGAWAESKGRRVMLLLGFSMPPLRALVFALTDSPALIVLAQALDGIAAACFGVLMPLVASDLAARSGRFNFTLGAMGFAIGIGGTLSPPLAGWIADRFGDPAAFVALAVVGLASVLLVLRAMPETRPTSA
jgi:MFS family permease